MLWMHHMDANKTEKKLDGNYTRMLPVVLNLSLKQHSAEQQLYGHLLPISKTMWDEQNMRGTAGEAKTNS